jgi:hypothetical protein
MAQRALSGAWRRPEDIGRAVPDFLGDCPIQPAEHGSPAQWNPVDAKGISQTEQSRNGEDAMSSQGNTDQTKFLTTAYVEVCRSYERIDDFRAKLLGFLPVVSGTGLLFILTRADMNFGDRGSPELLVPAGLFGLVVTVGLLFYELRGVQRCIRLHTVGWSLEGQMGVEGRFRRWPHSIGRFVNEPIATALIYPGVLAAWMFLAVFSLSVPFAIVAASVVLGVGFLGVRRFYRYITPSEEWQKVADDVFRRYDGRPQAEKVVHDEIIRRLDRPTGIRPHSKDEPKILNSMTKAIANGQYFQLEPGGYFYPSDVSSTRPAVKSP